MKKLLAISLALILALGMVSIAAAEDVITIGFAQVGHESDWRAANTLDYQNTFTAEMSILGICPAGSPNIVASIS